MTDILDTVAASNLILIGLLLVLVLAIFWLVSLYNRLVRTGVQTDEAWATVEVQVKRRASLVPNLAATVAGYAGHERETLEAVTRARQQVLRAEGAANVGVANTLLDHALGRLLVVVEQYPELKASANFLELQRELTDSEEKIAYARQFYNRCVMDYNAMLGTLPSSIIASALKLQPRPFFAAEGEAEAPTVRFAPTSQPQPQPPGE